MPALRRGAHWRLAVRATEGAAPQYEVTDVREVVLHMIEETAAHSRPPRDSRAELLDGQTGLGLALSLKNSSLLLQGWQGSPIAA